MKKLIYLLLTASLMCNVANGQKIAADKIPADVSSAFKTKFPDANHTSWEIENPNEYEAEFKLNGEEVSANFDNTGKWLETETEIKISDLPAPIQSSLRKDFGDIKIKETSKIVSATKGTCFEAEVEQGDDTFDILFSSDGKMLSKTKLDEKKGDKD